MNTIPVIAIFDVGKTNKKLFLFDSQYRIVYERSATLPEILDEDGENCEDLESLKASIYDSLREITALRQFAVKAINFTSYGASFVYIDPQGQPLTPLYNYLKEYPAQLSRQFYDRYGGEQEFTHDTASPVLGSLNSGMQLYRIKYERPALFNSIKYALHLPQYLSFLVTGIPCTDITSIGCHTNLWDFRRNAYHQWVVEEGIVEKLAPVLPADQPLSSSVPGYECPAGIGIHDSSSALIPYLVHFREPFILLSTGTWCISLNPFNHEPLTSFELEHDCLCYLTYEGKPVKAARLFAGHVHEQQVKRIAEHFNTDPAHYRNMAFDPELIAVLGSMESDAREADIKHCVFEGRELSGFEDDRLAYHQLMFDIMLQQNFSTRLVLDGAGVKRIFVDGGFSNNSIYMNLLAQLFPHMEVFAASIAQATAIGAALAIHGAWNGGALPGELIGLKRYSPEGAISL
jgi:sugar (pentulose or hexulose) kinase